jgi:hypothetical protein
MVAHASSEPRSIRPLLDRVVGETEVPEPDPENWQEQVKEMARQSRRLLQRHRDAAQISLGRIPAGPHSMPVLERYLAVLVAAGLPKRVIAYASDMFALYVGGFAFEESLRVPPLGDESASTAQLADYFRTLPPDEFGAEPLGRAGVARAQRHHVPRDDPERACVLGLFEPRELHQRSAGGREDRLLHLLAIPVDDVALAGHQGQLGRAHDPHSTRAAYHRGA